MPLRRPFLAAASLMAVALASGCNWPPGPDGGTGTSSGGSAPTTAPPVIDSLDMTASAYATNGVYPIFGTITYHDDDDIVVSAKVYVFVTGQTLDVAVPDPASSGVGQPLNFTLSADVPLGGAGPTNYTVSLVNKSGAVSQAVEETVTLL